jgi:SOS-response transcriptional repressor LexA
MQLRSRMAKLFPSDRAVSFKAWMARQKTNTRQVSLKTGVSYSTLASFVQGDTQSLKGKTEEVIADAYGTSTATVFGGATDAPTVFPPADALEADLDLIGSFVAEAGADYIPATARPVERMIPVLGEVAAGLWRETAAVEMQQVDDWAPVTVAGYERAALYALKVVGPSMNAVYPPGRFVIVAPAHEAGVRWGDYVIVERAKADMVEVTIKELVNDHGRAALWPRSHDPKYQEPIYLRGSADDQTAPRIIGVVVGDFGRRERPPA